MKRIILLLFLFTAFIANAQLSNYCDDFQSYKQLLDNKTNFVNADFSDNPVIGYGETQQKAMLDAKVQVLNRILYNQMYIDNPLVDTLIGQFSGEVINLVKDEYDMGKTPKKYRSNGKFTCIVNKISYNSKLTDFLKEKIDNFLKSQAVFIINPFVDINGDALTKQVYNDAKTKFLTAMGASKYKLDGIKETRMLEIPVLPYKPVNYNPCDSGFRYYRTANKYLDFVNGIINNANRSLNVDIVFSIDTITVTKTPDLSHKVVSFHILAVDAHNSSIIMVYDLNDSVDANLSDFDGVKNATNSIFTKKADVLMYELIKRYSNYIRDGVEFSMNICSKLLTQGKADELEDILATCNMFVKGSIKPGEWRNNGESIGKMYTGRTYIIDPLLLKTNLRKMLKDVGLVNFTIDVSGLTYIVTPLNE